MQWKLKVRNPQPGGGSEVAAARIQADNLTKAIEKAAARISPDFRGFSLVQVRQVPQRRARQPN